MHFLKGRSECGIPEYLGYDPATQQLVMKHFDQNDDLQVWGIPGQQSQTDEEEKSAITIEETEQ